MKKLKVTKTIVLCSLSALFLLGSSHLHGQTTHSKLLKGEAQDTNRSKLYLRQTEEPIFIGQNRVRNKNEVTSAINKVNGEELGKTNSMNPANSLYGLLPGLTVLQNTGTAGSRNPDLYIRGINTLNNNNILVLVDGIQADITNLSIQSIESVEVLKDAAALAVYGQRGANGVLLIKTKRGVHQKMDVNVDLEYGLLEPTQLPAFLDAAGYARAINEARYYDGLTPLYSEDDIAMYEDGASPSFFPNVDWLQESLRDRGDQMNLNLSFLGGDDVVRYYAELDYRAENGLYNEYDLEEFSTQLKYDRINFRTNLDLALTPTTNLTGLVSGGIDETNFPGTSTDDIFRAMFHTPAAAFPVKNYNDNWGGTSVYGNNPAAMISSTGYSRYQGVDVSVYGILEQDLSLWTEGLSAELTVGHIHHATSIDGQSRNYMYEELRLSEGEPLDTLSQTFGQDTKLSANSGHGAVRRFTQFSGMLKYHRNIGDHLLDAFLMYSQEKGVGKWQYSTFTRQNIAGNIHYGYKNRYFADLTLSYAGSSVLPAGDRFYLYPAVSAGWVISEEDFMNNSWVQYLKLRGSFGFAGNDRITQNTEDQSYGGVGAYFFTDNNNQTGSFGEGRMAGDPRPERAMMSNVGVDVSIIERLNFSMDMFYNKRTDILVSTEGKISGVLGVDPPLQPIGEVDNKGLETVLTWQDHIGDFQYSATGIFSFARNKIIEMGENPQFYSYLMRTGKPVGQAFGLISDGFFNDETEIANGHPQLFSVLSPGDVRYVDQNDDQIIDEYDVVAIGHSTDNPEMYFSMNLGAEYKGFGVNALFQGIANQTVYLNTPNVYWPLINNNNISVFSNDRWTEETMESAELPRLSTLDNDNNYRQNDIWLSDADYLKLRYVEVYYRFPDMMLNNTGINTLKLFARGTNLFSWDVIEQMDPETTSIAYPALRTYNLGLKFSF